MLILILLLFLTHRIHTTNTPQTTQTDASLDCRIFQGKEDPKMDNLIIATYHQAMSQDLRFDLLSFENNEWLSLYEGGVTNFAFAFVECSIDSKYCYTNFTESSKVVEQSCSAVDFYQNDKGFDFFHSIALHPWVMSTLASWSDPNAKCGGIQKDVCVVWNDFKARFHPIGTSTPTAATFLKDLMQHVPSNMQKETTVVFITPYDASLIWNLYNNASIKPLGNQWRRLAIVNLINETTTIISESSKDFQPMNEWTPPSQLCITQQDLREKGSQVARAIIDAATTGAILDFPCKPNPTATTSTKATETTTAATATNGSTTTQQSGESTTTTTTTTRSPDQTTTTTPTGCYEPREDECGCNVATMWNDVVLVIDSSLEMGQKNFDQLVAFIKSTLKSISIGQDETKETQLGVIIYNDKVHVLASLTAYKSTADMMDDVWQYMGGNGTNMAKALAKADDELFTEGRPGARPVILLLTSFYHPSDEDPVQIAEDFKEDGGIIISIGFGDLHGKVNETMRKVASPGFFYQLQNLNQQTANETILRRLCDANCFCPGTGNSGDDKFYPVPTTERTDIPNGGCFFDTTLTSIQQFVDRFCRGMLIADLKARQAMPKYLDQQIQILHAQNETDVYHIGLQKNSSVWIWNDKVLYCQPDGTPTLSPNHTCSILQWDTVNQKPQILSDDCLGTAQYACQVEPCSSVNDCPSKTKFFQRRKIRKNKMIKSEHP